MTTVTVPIPVSVPAGFAADLRDHTKAVHRAAERAGFVADLLHGRATPRGYATFLRALHPAYAALERALVEHLHDPLVAAFADPGLHRKPALEADLDALDAGWAERPAIPAAAAYAEEIRVAGDNPATLVGHAYARYLGDLSGGQILKPLLARSLDLGPEALNLYEFPAYPDLAVPKTRLRDALDAVPADGAAAQGIRAGAMSAFRHAIAVAEGVAAAVAVA